MLLWPKPCADRIRHHSGGSMEVQLCENDASANVKQEGRIKKYKSIFHFHSYFEFNFISQQHATHELHQLKTSWGSDNCQLN